MMHYSLVSVFGSLAWERLRAHHTGYCVDPVSGEGGGGRSNKHSATSW